MKITFDLPINDVRRLADLASMCRKYNNFVNGADAVVATIIQEVWEREIGGTIIGPTLREKVSNSKGDQS